MIGGRILDKCQTRESDRIKKAYQYLLSLRALIINEQSEDEKNLQEKEALSF